MKYFLKQLKLIELKNDPQLIDSLVEKQWNDIHHSRNQDWMYWAIISAIIAGIIALISNEKDFSDKILFNTILNILYASGIIISSWAAAISWSHWNLHIRRLGYISWLESLYYINRNNKSIPLSLPIYDGFTKKDKFIVNGLIFSMYASIAILFLIVFSVSELISLHVIIINNSIQQNLNELAPILLLVFGAICIYLIHQITSHTMSKFKDEYLKWLEEIIEN